MIPLRVVFSSSALISRSLACWIPHPAAAAISSTHSSPTSGISSFASAMCQATGFPRHCSWRVRSGLIRIAAMRTRHPEQLLERINEQLCARNEANIFVTLFCAFLDVVSGRLVYANGGHAFSAERLLCVGAANCGQSVEDLLSSVQRELATFLDGMPFADDCTLVAVRRPVRSRLR
jgi:hypothetical protein